MLADGGDCLSHVATLRDQPDLFGSVASSPTAWRVIEAIDDERLGAIREARATARARAWAAGLSPVTEHGYVTSESSALGRCRSKPATVWLVKTSSLSADSGRAK